MADKAVWEDPPRVGTAPEKGVWVKRLEEAKLRRKPEKWARLMECDDADQASNWARNINHARVLLPPGRWEATSATATDADGKHKHHYLYVRFLGD